MRKKRLAEYFYCVASAVTLADVNISTSPPGERKQS